MRTRGFTLIELMVVIAIIAVLTSIISVSIASSKQKSRDSKRVADVKLIQLALSQYYNDNGMYPLNIYAASGAAPGGGLAPTYLPVVPIDPQGGTGSCSAATANSSGTGCYRYTPYTTSSSGICSNSSSNLPIIYHIGAGFEDTSSSALSQDIDGNSSLSNVYTSITFYRCTTSPSPASFDGNAGGCTGTSAATPDGCYDLTP